MMDKMPPKGLFLCNVIVLPSGKQEGGNVGLFGQSEQSDCFEEKLSANQYRLLKNACSNKVRDFVAANTPARDLTPAKK